MQWPEIYSCNVDALSRSPHLRSGVYMVFVAQSEECLIVIQEVVGSKPTIHPINAHIVQWIEHSATNRGIGVRISLRVQEAPFV